MKNTELEQLINEKLNSAAFSDYAPNGLQVEGRETVQKIITGVTASQALIDEAIRQQADAVIVHHGYFWKGESPVIRGMKRNRLKALLANDINLYGWHLPLDAHPELGNNAQLAQLLGINIQGEIEAAGTVGASCRCRFPVLSWHHGLKLVWGENRCGAGIPGQIKSRASPGVPAVARALSTARRVLASMRLLPVKWSEQTIHSAREQGAAFLCRGASCHRTRRHSRAE
ncbi:metal-binding protein [Kluyvera cryocrescens]|uniref:Metal-binding protein n=1 Tax=Kluyvera cryocrescens TaxID=580 RepID=A0A485CM71_KLUCR|nr:metal-binding protein [Kluyvera cryocrescens]